MAAEEGNDLALNVTHQPSALTSAAPDETPHWTEDNLLGDWSGLRADLYTKGINVGLTQKIDVLRNVRGGIRSGSGVIGHTEARMSLNLEKLVGWEATDAFILYHSNLGSKFNRDRVGAAVGVDNIEVGTNTAQFFHAWIQKHFADDSLSLKAGLYPIDSEFYVTDTSGVFLQPPYGMSNELAQTGQNGPPIFPLGALAVRAKYTTSDKHYYAMGAITDGVPGDPKNPRGTHVKLEKGDGSLVIAELGYAPPTENESFNKAAIGFWRYSAQFADLTGPDMHTSQGVYFLAERTFTHEKTRESNGLSGFLRYGVASDQVNAMDWTGSIGIRYRGLISGRDDDVAGFAITVNHAGSPFRQTGAFESSEIDYELTYRAQVQSWFALQPTLQQIVNPGFDPTVRNALVIGLRAEIEF